MSRKICALLQVNRFWPSLDENLNFEGLVQLAKVRFWERFQEKWLLGYQPVLGVILRFDAFVHLFRNGLPLLLPHVAVVDGIVQVLITSRPKHTAVPELLG